MESMKELKVLVVALFLLGCGSSSTVSEVTTTETQALEELVTNGNMEIRVTWAHPLPTTSLNSLANAGLLAPGDTPSRINLTGNPGFIRIKGDVVSGYLPYFGERQMGGGYNLSDTGIQFDGVPIKLEWSKDSRTQGYILNFSMGNSTETYGIHAKISPSLKSIITVNSTHRTTISYLGEVREYSQEDGILDNYQETGLKD